MVQSTITHKTSTSTHDDAQTQAPAQQRTCVLDTSVLLSDPGALFRFAEHDVLIPIVVVTELEGKRHDLELGYFARQALHHLDRLREQHGRLDEPVPLPAGGTLRVSLGRQDASALPPGLRAADADSRILATAASLAEAGAPVTLVTKDVPLRVKAAAIGLRAEEYRAEQTVDSGWTGVSSLDVAGDEVADLYDSDVALSEAVRGLPVNTGVVLHSERGGALARVVADGEVRLIHGDRELFGLRGRSAEQRIAIDALLDPSIGIVSLGGRAGTGKSALALCAGLEAVLEQRRQRKIIVFRPLFAVGGQELGYLPGDQQDKMGPWGQAVFDTLSSVVSANVIDEVLSRDLLEVLPLTHIRGRSLHDAFVIVDEAQSLERNVLLTVLSRIGQNSKVVLTHDVGQRDNLHVGRHDGVASVVETLKGSALFAHVTLTRSERSQIAALVTELMDGQEPA